MASSCLVSFAAAQAPAPAGSPDKASPLKGIDENYGTSNVGKPNAVVVNPGPNELIQLQTVGKVLQTDQQRRLQPPGSRRPFAVYMGQDPMLARYAKLIEDNPALDPTLLTVLAWNHVALDMTSIDHTTDPTGKTKLYEPTYGEQFGPPRASRAMAIVHLAIFEAANLVDKTYASYRAPGAGRGNRFTRGHPDPGRPWVRSGEGVGSGRHLGSGVQDFAGPVSEKRAAA